VENIIVKKVCIIAHIEIAGTSHPHNQPDFPFAVDRTPTFPLLALILVS